MDSTVSNLVHPNLTVTKEKGALTKDKVVYQVVGVSTEVEYKVHNNNIDNLEKAVLERVFFVEENGIFREPVRPAPRVIERTLKRFRDELLSHLHPTTPITRDEFAAMYRGRRQTIYKTAAESLVRNPLSDKDAFISVFGKVEKTNVTAKPNAVMRVISPRGPRFNVEVGKYLKPLEPKIYAAVTKVFGEQTIFKGLNAKERGAMMRKKWEKFSDPVAIGIDAKRFDQHVSDGALKWEHSVYQGVYGSREKYLRTLLGYQIKNTCIGRTPNGKLKFTIVGCRMSGDMNTALGNCLIMCGLVHAYMSSIKVRKYSLANDGDDCTIIVERRFVPRVKGLLAEWFALRGFTMKVEEPVDRIECIDFCQSHPIFDGKDYIMVRDPRVTLSKDAISVKPLDSERIYRRWIGTVGDGGLSLTGGMPVLQEYYESFRRAAGDIKRLENEPTLETGMAMLARGMHRKYGEVDWRTRVSFYYAFGMMPDYQRQLEAYYRNHTPTWEQPIDGPHVPSVICNVEIDHGVNAQDQNGFRANQNAERLHGSARRGSV